MLRSLYLLLCKNVVTLPYFYSLRSSFVNEVEMLKICEIFNLMSLVAGWNMQYYLFSAWVFILFLSFLKQVFIILVTNSRFEGGKYVF